MELCGGTHVRATGDIGFFTIVQEVGIAAGVRRIEALTGAGAVDRYQQRRAVLDRMLETLNVPEDQAVEAIERAQSELKKLSREVTQLKTKAALGGVGAATPDQEVTDIAGVKAVARKVVGLEKAALREVADSVKSQLKSGVVVLASSIDGRVSIVVSVTADLIPPLHAGNIVKQIAPIVGGGGGGRPDFAEAGGKDPARIDEMLAESRRVIGRMLKG
jgi:alanyl-tRNA synthetase